MKVNNGTKKADEMKWDFRHHHHKGDTIYDVYERPSSAKVSSWKAIERKCEELDGRHLHITGASCHTYSCMYAFPVKDDEGVIIAMMLRKETHVNTYDLKVSLDEYESLIRR